MTALTLSGGACETLAVAVEALGVREPEAAQRIADALRDCATHYGRTTVTIELEPDESSFVDAAAAERRATKRAELRLVRPEQPSDLALVLELAERFLSEGEPLPGLTQIQAVDAIARLRRN